MEKNKNKLTVLEMLHARNVNNLDISVERYREIERAVSWGSFHVYYNFYGEPEGYLMWSWVSPETIKRMVRTNTHDLHVEDWQEGRILYVIDLVVSGAIRIRDVENFVFNMMGKRRLVVYRKNEVLVGIYRGGNKRKKICKFPNEI